MLSGILLTVLHEDIYMKSFKHHFYAMTAAIGALLLGFAPSAHAVPSFARQTGMACAACHVEFPELGHFGRDFKLGGYTLTTTASVEERLPVERLLLNAIPPLSAMLQISYTRTKEAQPDTVIAGHTVQNGEFLLPQQLSLFYAGRITSNVGAFVQLTYDGLADKVTIDNTDLRIADNAEVWGNRLTYGLTINNNPTVQDLWNTAPAWGFPYASSPIAPAPAAATLLDGPLAQQVGGLGVYGGYHLGQDLLYAELTLYRSMQPGSGVTSPQGLDSATTNPVVSGSAPYIRLAYEHAWGDNTWEVGLFDMRVDTTPQNGVDVPVDAARDRRTDLAFDTQFQHHAADSTFSVHAIHIRETQDWGSATLGLGDAANAHDSLTTDKVLGKYYFKREYGLTVQYVQTKGDSDSGIYKPSDPALPSTFVNASASGSPDSRYWTYELDYMPRDNTRFALQYVDYNKFNGDSSNYNGQGRNAKDNNTLYLYGWFMF